MRKIVILLSVLISLTGCTQLLLVDSSQIGLAEEAKSGLIDSSDSEVYYYYFDEKIPLGVHHDMLVISFNDAEGKDDFLLKIDNGVSSIIQFDPDGDGRFCARDSRNSIVIKSLGKNFSDEYILGLLSRNKIDCVSKMLDYQGAFLAQTNEFSVKLKNMAERGELEKLASKYKCSLSQKDFFEEDVFFVEVPRDSNSVMNSISFANAFYETGLFEFVSPDFVFYDPLNTTDPQYYLQWGLHNTGQFGSAGIDVGIESAWNFTQGDSNIIIAVLDTGVDINHNELQGQLVDGYDAEYGFGVGTPMFMSEDHGTNVAGIIGAIKDNGDGISGVSPGCRIMPIRVGNSNYFSTSAIAAAFNWASSHGADVINCSWSLSAPISLITSTIQNSVNFGRDGKGCVVVFSSGNTRWSNHGEVNYPASLGFVLAVGAISYDGKRVTLLSPGGDMWSSNYGNALDLVAPGVRIYTTFIGNLVGEFSGTSAAAPFVSGIAALILSQNPELPQGYVRQSIVNSCYHLPDYYFADDSMYPVHYRNPEVGYGLVNANHALAEASRASLQNAIDNTPGFDFVILNDTSYSLGDIILDVQGRVGGQMVSLVSCDMYENIEPLHRAGYPVYRGTSLSAAPGTLVTDISLNLFASSSDYYGEFEIGVGIDIMTPNTFDRVSFGMGNSYYTELPDTVIHSSRRPIIYIHLFNAI